MTKKVKISFLILVWSIVTVQMYVNHMEMKKEKQQVVTAFSVVEEDSVQDVIWGTGYLGKMQLTKDMQYKLLESFAKKIGITEGYTYSSDVLNSKEMISLIKGGKNANTLLQVISVTTDAGETEQYFSVKIETKAEMKDALACYKKIKKVFEELELEGSVRLEVMLEKNENYQDNASKKKQLVENLFNSINAKMVSEQETKDLYTVYGHIFALDDFVAKKEQKADCQITLSYSEIDDKTYIKIGFPSVESSY